MKTHALQSFLCYVVGDCAKQKMFCFLVSESVCGLKGILKLF